MAKLLFVTPVLFVWFFLRRLIGAGLIIVGAWGAVFAGFLAIPALIALVLLLIEGYLFVTGDPGSMALPCLGVIVAYLVAILAGMYAFPAGRSLLTPTYWEASWRRRPPILLLRSFTDDRLGTPFDFGTQANLNMTRALGSGMARGLPGGGGFATGMGYTAARSVVRMMHMSESFEEVLVAHLKSYGPVVTIARPGERWKPAGAARLTVKGEGEEWKLVVTDLIRRSSLVVMLVGKTPGVTWEVNEVISRAAADKLWLIFPTGDSADLAERWGLFRDRLLATGVTGAPETLDEHTVLARFDESWTLRPLSAIRERESYMLLIKNCAEDYFSAQGILTLSTRLKPLKRAWDKAVVVFGCACVALWIIIVIFQMSKSRR